MFRAEWRELEVLPDGLRHRRPVVGERDLSLGRTQRRKVVTPEPAAELAIHALRLKARYGDRDVKRASIDLDPDTQAVPDPVPRRWDNGATVTGIRKRDTGQVAQGVRDRDRHLAHRDTRAGPSAGGAELRRYRCQIPVNGLSTALPGLHIPSLFQPDTGTSVALGIPAESALDLLAGRLAPICWQQLEQSPLVLVRLMPSLFHGLKLAHRPGRVRLLALPLWGRRHERFPCPGVQADSARSTNHQSQ